MQDSKNADHWTVMQHVSHKNNRRIIERTQQEDHFIGKRLRDYYLVESDLFWKQSLNRVRVCSAWIERSTIAIIALMENNSIHIVAAPVSINSSYSSLFSSSSKSNIQCFLNLKYLQQNCYLHQHRYHHR